MKGFKGGSSPAVPASALSAVSQVELLKVLGMLYEMILPRPYIPLLLVGLIMKFGSYLNLSCNLLLPYSTFSIAHIFLNLNLSLQFDREHFSEVFVDLKWFESKVGNKYLNEAAGIAAEEARNNKQKKQKVSVLHTLFWK